jgi:hypothetical protein
MANIIKIECAYLTLHVGMAAKFLGLPPGRFTLRQDEIPQIPFVKEFSNDNGIIPLCVVTGGKIGSFVSDKEFRIDWNSHNESCREIINRLGANNLATDNLIIFKVPDLATATKVFAVVNGERYLQCFITNISFISDDNGKLNLVYVDTRDKRYY